MNEKRIKINELILWDKNARFPTKYFNKNEDELINYFWSDNSFKIKKLAQEIIEDIDLPQLEKLVVVETDKGNVVFEGNRRLVAYKLLLNPEKAGDKDSVEFFTALNKGNVVDDRYELECIVCNEGDAQRYIDRKHLNANNEIGWGDNERAHYNARRGNAKDKENIKVGISKIIQGLDIPESLKEQVLGVGFVTTLWRLLESTPARDEFGYSIDGEGRLTIQDDKFGDKLIVIIHDVLSKSKYNNKIFSRLNKNDISGYLKTIDESRIKDSKESINSAISENLFGEKKVEIITRPKKYKTKINPKSSLRKYLIPKTCRLTIDEPKINNIYRELRDSLLLDDSNSAVPNAVGVLFRVFLESSIDYFHKSIEHQEFSKGAKLATKITHVADYLENNNIADKHQLKNIRIVATNKNNILAIENFHSYVHDYKMQPTPGDLKLKWDNLQKFFEIIYSKVGENEK